MKMPQSIKQRLKKYFTTKPKGNFWKSAFIYLFIFRYFSPLMIFFSLFLMMGLIAPESDISPTIEKITQSLTESFMFIGQKMFEVGQNIAINNPIISKIIFFAFANFIWVFYIGLLIMFGHMMRYFISWVINKSSRSRRAGK